VLRLGALRRPVLRRPVLWQPVLRRPVLWQPVLRIPVLRQPVLQCLTPLPPYARFTPNKLKHHHFLSCQENVDHHVKHCYT